MDDQQNAHLNDLSKEELIKYISSSQDQSSFWLNFMSQFKVLVVILTTVITGIISTAKYFHQQALHDKEIRLKEMQIANELEIKHQEQVAQALNIYLQNFDETGHSLSKLRFFCKTGNDEIKAWARDELLYLEHEIDAKKSTQNLVEAKE